MASIRTARALAAVAALPLAAALFSGVAAADGGAPAKDGKTGPNVGVAHTVGAVGKHNDGNFLTVPQQAVGSGALNQNNTAQIEDSKIVVIDRSKANIVLNLTPGAGPGEHGHHRS